MSLKKEKSQTAKILNISSYVLKTFRSMNEEFQSIDFNDINHYESMKKLSESEYLERKGKTFKMTENGYALLEDIETYLDQGKYEIDEDLNLNLSDILDLKEDIENRDVVKINYMRKHPTEDLIESHVAIFEKESDGIPIIVVNEDNYTNVLLRNPNEHWKKYVGEAARKLIRDKKLDRVYIQNESNGRKYLYDVPKK